MQDQFLTSAEVCDRLRIDEQTLRSWRKQGLLRAYRLGPRVFRYSQAELQEFIAAGATDSEAAS